MRFEDKVWNVQVGINYPPECWKMNKVKMDIDKLENRIEEMLDNCILSKVPKVEEAEIDV